MTCQSLARSEVRHGAGAQSLLAYKSLNGLGLEYTNKVLIEYKASRALGSMDSGQIVEPRVQTKQ